MGHHFFVIRAVAPNDSETKEQIQDRLCRDYHETLEDYDA